MINHEVVSVNVCPNCWTKKDVKNRHLKTFYLDDDRNYLFSCFECFVDIWEGYERAWGDSSEPWMASWFGNPEDYK